jgi:hypothetical protein
VRASPATGHPFSIGSGVDAEGDLYNQARSPARDKHMIHDRVLRDKSEPRYSDMNEAIDS